MFTKEMFDGLLAGKTYQNEWHTKIFIENNKLRVIGPNIDTEDDYRLTVSYFWEEVIPTILIDDVDVPAPLKQVKDGDTYYYVSFDHLFCGGVSANVWKNTTADNLRLANGLVHSTKENAEIHAQALLSFTDN